MTKSVRKIHTKLLYLFLGNVNMFLGDEHKGDLENKDLEQDLDKIPMFS